MTDQPIQSEKAARSTGVLGVIRDAIPESVRRNPLAVTAPVLGGVAIVYAGVVVWALGTHPRESERRVEPLVGRFEAAATGWLQRRTWSLKEGESAYRLEKGDSLDANGDGHLTVADAVVRLRELCERALGGAATGIGLTEYVGLGGSAGVFTLLDANGDDLLEGMDLVSTASRPMGPINPPAPSLGGKDRISAGADGTERIDDPDAWDGTPSVDPRNGRALVLDPLRASWLQEMAALDGSGAWRWRGKALPAELMSRAALGKLTLKDGREFECFLVRNEPEGKATVIGMDGETSTYALGPGDAGELAAWQEYRDQALPAAKWLAAMRALVNAQGSANAGAWAELALAFRAIPGMANEAEDAAKRALIHEPWREELWPLVGVRRQGRQLVRDR